MNGSLKAVAEKAARSVVPAPDIHEVVVSETAPRGTSQGDTLCLSVRVLLHDESERCFEYRCSPDGTGGKLTPVDCGTGDPLPDFENPPYRG